jgi:hypothetical protein
MHLFVKIQFDCIWLETKLLDVQPEKWNQN